MGMAEVQQPITGKVADILDRYSLVINRGQGAGVEVGMIFLVMGLGGSITDPDTGEDLGPRPIEKLRVKVTDVHEKFSIAETYRIVTPPTLTSFIQEVGGIQPIHDIFLEQQRPQREYVAGAPSSREPTPMSPDVDVKVGDTVRQLVR